MHKKTFLKNGIRLITERFDNVRSVSVGVWVQAGSAYETKANNGISHFIEHMLFKGTPTMSAKEIAEGIDYLGGHINAFTGKDCTSYYIKVLDEQLEPALKILADLFCNSKFDKADIDMERKVVDEEILMSEDSPEDLVHDMIVANVFKDSGFGLPILGTTNSLKNIGSGEMKKYMADNYFNSHVVISVAGNFEQVAIETLIEKYFGGRDVFGDRQRTPSIAKFDGSILTKKKETEQVHFCLGLPTYEYDNPLAYAVLLVNTVFGGGMSSRLFQKIREERGLVYSIFSYPTTNVDSGVFTIYAGMTPGNLNQVLELISKEIKLLKTEGISKDLIEKTKNQLKGNIILGMESPSSRMNSNARSEILKGKIQTQDELIAKMNEIDEKQVHEVIDFIFDSGACSAAMIGSLENVDIKNLFS